MLNLMVSINKYIILNPTSFKIKNEDKGRIDYKYL
jgi:hypothetical protein